MNRFDRVTSILLLLQTRSVITARFLSEHFDVTERTIYRDIRTLENAGVPIGLFILQLALAPHRLVSPARSTTAVFRAAGDSLER